MREALSAEGAAAWRAHLAALAPPVAAAASERYYKVGSEALRACSAVCRVIRPDAPAPVPSDLQVRPGARTDSEHLQLKLLRNVVRRGSSLSSDQKHSVSCVLATTKMI